MCFTPFHLKNKHNKKQTKNQTATKQKQPINQKNRKKPTTHKKTPNLSCILTESLDVSQTGVLEIQSSTFNTIFET